MGTSGGDRPTRTELSATYATLRPGAMVLAALGDSITANDNGADYEGTNLYSRTSWLSLACMRSGSRIRYGKNFGIPGQQSAAILARIPDVIAAKPTHCVVTIGANDGDAIASVNFTRTACQSLLAAGIFPIIGNRPPRGSAASSEHENLRRQNAGLRALAIELRVPLADFFTALVDPVTGYYVGSLMGDEVHPNAAGWGAMADALLTALDLASFVRAYERPDNTQLGSELVFNGLFQQFTAGVPDGWSIAQNDGGSVVSAVTGDARFPGGTAVQIASPGAVSVSAILRQAFAVVAGNKIEIGFAAHGTGADQGDGRVMRLEIMDGGYATKRLLEFRGVNVGGHITTIFTAPSANFIVDIRVQLGAGAATTHRIGAVSFRDLTALGIV